MTTERKPDGAPVAQTPSAPVPNPKAIGKPGLPEDWAQDLADNLNRNVLAGAPTN